MKKVNISAEFYLCAFPADEPSPREIGLSAQGGHLERGRDRGDKGPSPSGTAQEGGLPRESRRCPGRRLGWGEGWPRKLTGPAKSQPLWLTWAVPAPNPASVLAHGKTRRGAISPSPSLLFEINPHRNITYVNAVGPIDSESRQIDDC